jgi:hypothetical protein
MNDANNKTGKALAKTGTGCMCVFSLFFLLPGLGIMGYGLYGWSVYIQSESWVETPARILSAKLETHSGDDSDTYSVNCRYQYGFGGKTYTNDRVGIIGGSSSEYEYHNKHFRLLQEHLRKEKPFPALVNPANPQDAILFRDTSLALYALPPFGLVFALVGGGLLFASVFGVLGEKRKRRLLDDNPTRPWRAERKWETFSVKGGALKKVLAAWGTGIFMALFLSIFWIALLKDGHAPAFAFGIVGLFQLIDFCIMGSAVYLTLRYLKYGVPTLVFPRLPLALGEEATILLVVKRHIFPEGGIKAKLKCVTSITTGSGKHRNTVEKVIYECEKAFNEDMADESKGSAIPLVFALPADQPPRDGESTPAILWKLEIAAETPGIDFAASFDDLPVYAVSNRELIETHPDYR